jgi:predicted Fe-Mo cluster-binding NifX family protein
MRICFPVNHDKGMDGPVYAHFGSAPRFVIFDTENETVEVVDNRNAHHVHGACNPAFALANYKVDAIVVGGIGAGALSRLNQMGIKVYQALKGKIMDNLELFKQGKLTEISTSSCHDHDHGHEHEHEHHHGQGMGLGIGRGRGWNLHRH